MSEIKKNCCGYQFRTDVVTTVPTWTLIEDIQALRKAISQTHLSDYNSVMDLIEQVGVTIDCLEAAIEHDTKVPDGLCIKPSGSSLIAPSIESGIIICSDGSDIKCPAGKPISQAMAGGVCQCDESCPHFNKCFGDNEIPRGGMIMPMSMDPRGPRSGEAIVNYLDTAF